MDGVRLTIGNKGVMLARLAVLSTVALSHGQAPSYFSDADRDAIKQFWSKPGRYLVEASKSSFSKGPWVVRLTPQGSTWLFKFDSARGLGKSPAPKANIPSADIQRTWSAWISQKIAYDRFVALKACDEANALLTSKASKPVDSVANPGQEPNDLKAFAGEAPSFACAVIPNEYHVRFDDGRIATLSDNPAMRPDYAFYRFPQGVLWPGTPVKNLPESELSSLFEEAQVSPSARRVMKAVSSMEGGFDAVNTYDTGYVSVGLIQFACLSKGAGALGQVLLQEKQNDSEAFAKDFHQYGLEVTAAGALVALDIEKGSVLEGPAAARQIINDKRLTAVFEHAGQTSRAFRIAQLQVAMQAYYPSDDKVEVKTKADVLQGKVCDFLHSEAAMATLMDRKVSTGNIDPLNTVLAKIAEQCDCHSSEDFAAYERDIIGALTLRKDYLSEPELTQPAAFFMRAPILLSRHGGRSLRKHSRGGGG